MGMECFKTHTESWRTGEFSIAIVQESGNNNLACQHLGGHGENNRYVRDLVVKINRACHVTRNWLQFRKMKVTKVILKF